MPRKRWEFAQYDKQTAKMLAEECEVDPFVALLLNARGYNQPEEIEEYLSLEPMFADPFLISGINEAADRVIEAIDGGETIAVFGDYDCDGVTATALMVKCLENMGAKVCSYIPDRIREGYGMNYEAIEKLANQGVTLIITVDNGIGSAQQIEFAKQNGIDVIVTDHHLPPQELPDAVAVIDPHLPNSGFEYRDISGVGVAFRFACVLQEAAPEELLYDYADLLALGTIADIMPLTGENRFCVAAGIQRIADGSNIGLSALLEIAGLGEKPITATSVAFLLSPRINAAGRLGDANRALRLLITEEREEADALAGIIDRENSKRQKIEQDIYEQAVVEIEEKGFVKDRVIVACGKGWHRGIVGISAAKICEKYGRPVILLSEEDGVAVGSGRGPAGFNLYEAVSSASNVLDHFGGHEQAAGLTLPASLVDSFRRQINEYASEISFATPVLKLDCKLKPSAFSFELADAIESMQPFGYGNPVPVFGVLGAKIEKIIPLSGGKHIRVQFSKDLSVFVGLLFGMSPDCFGYAVGDIVDIAVTVSTGIYNGERQLTLQIKDMRMSGSDEELQLKSDAAYSEFIFSNQPSCSLELGREVVGVVYRAVGHLLVCKDRIVNHLEYKMGCGVANAALDVLTELGLIERQTIGNTVFYKRNVVSGKTDLMQSEIFRMLARGE